MDGANEVIPDVDAEDEFTSDEDWEAIDALLLAHAKKTFRASQILSTGFGGDKGLGVLLVNENDKTKVLPPMKFTLNNANYRLLFKHGFTDD